MKRMHAFCAICNLRCCLSFKSVSRKITIVEMSIISELLDFTRVLMGSSSLTRFREWRPAKTFWQILPTCVVQLSVLSIGIPKFFTSLHQGTGEFTYANFRKGGFLQFVQSVARAYH